MKKGERVTRHCFHIKGVIILELILKITEHVFMARNDRVKGRKLE